MKSLERLGMRWSYNQEDRLKVSVVILAKNEEKNIGKCLYYLMNQTYKNFEIILVDGNSTDSTVEIAKSYGAKIIKEERNKTGFGYARNLGIKNANGEVIAFLSADAFLIDNRTIEKCMKSIENYGVSGTGCKVTFPKNPLGVYLSRPFERPLQIKSKLSRPPLCATFLMLKRDAFKGLVFDENFKEGAEDLDLFFRLYRRGNKLLYNPEVEIFHNTDCSIHAQARRAYKDGKELKKLYKKHGIEEEGFSSVLYPLKALLASAYSCLGCIKRIGISGIIILLYNYKLMMKRRRGFLDG